MTLMSSMKVIFIIVSSFLSFSYSAASQSSEFKVCSSGSDVFTANGEKVDLASLLGLHVSAGAHGGVCQIEAIEGLVWWRDGNLTAVKPADTSGWMPYKVAFSFLMSPGVDKKAEIRGFLRRPDWDGITLNLAQYPRLQIRLNPQNHPSQPAGFEGVFVMEDFRGEDGRRKLIYCSVAATSLAAGKGKGVKNLTALELTARDFSQDYDLCEMDLLDFSLHNGAGRITFSIELLRSATIVLPAIFDYIEKASPKKGV